MNLIKLVKLSAMHSALRERCLWRFNGSDQHVWSGRPTHGILQTDRCPTETLRILLPRRPSRIFSHWSWQQWQRHVVAIGNYARGHRISQQSRSDSKPRWDLHVIKHKFRPIVVCQFKKKKIHVAKSQIFHIKKKTKSPTFIPRLCSIFSGLTRLLNSFMCFVKFGGDKRFCKGHWDSSEAWRANVRPLDLRSFSLFLGCTKKHI